MKKIVLVILTISCLAVAKMKDMYIVVDGNTPLQVQNFINGLPCKWKAIGELQYIHGMWYQVVVCRNVSEQKRGYFRSLLKKEQSK